MHLRRITILALILLVTLSADGQRKRKRSVRRVVQEIVKEPEEDPRITNMREMTQQIVFIDSVVVDRDRILPLLRLSSEAGSLMAGEAFAGKLSVGCAFLNEMGNKVYFSQADSVGGPQHLYTSDKLGSSWGKATALTGLGEGISEAAYPFMLSDGITLYFAAKGEESIGGYDIFLTRYDSRSGSFFKPENIGMPFNSAANDYLYAIDEFNRIGYFVSDRRQPEGKVCLYIFIPPTTRTSYDTSTYTEEQIRGFADIASIADTWQDKAERQEALNRLRSIAAKKGRPATESRQEASADTDIIINDQHTYSSVSDFQSAQAATLYEQLLEKRRQLSTLEEWLAQKRSHAAEGHGAARKEILRTEEELFQAKDQIRALVKRIRHLENTVIQ